MTGSEQPNSYDLAVGRLVQSAWQRAGMTQSQLERAAELQPTTISRAERGETELGVYELARVAGELNVGPADLIPPIES